MSGTLLGSSCCHLFFWVLQNFISPFFPPMLLRYNWQVILCKLKVYNIENYILQNYYHHSISFPLNHVTDLLSFQIYPALLCFFLSRLNLPAPSSFPAHNFSDPLYHPGFILGIHFSLSVGIELDPVFQISIAFSVSSPQVTWGFPPFICYWLAYSATHVG